MREQDRDKEKEKQEEKPEDGLKLERNDMLAMIIAVFQILLPYILVIAAAFTLLILFVTKIWLI